MPSSTHATPRPTGPFSGTCLAFPPSMPPVDGSSLPRPPLNSPAIPLRAMANMSSISCATTCGRRLPVSARKGSRAAPSATRDGASYPQYAFQAAAISGFTSRVTQQPIGRATERAAAVGAVHVRLGSFSSDRHAPDAHGMSASPRKRTSHAVIDEPREEVGADDELAPLRVESGGWLRGNRVLERPPLLLELRDVVAYRHEHVAIFRQLCLVAHRLAMAGHDDRLFRYGGNIRLGRLDHPVDVTAGRVVDEGIDAVPVRITAMKNVGFWEGDGDVAVRMRGPIVLQGKFGTVQVNRLV